MTVVDHEDVSMCKMLPTHERPLLITWRHDVHGQSVVGSATCGWGQVVSDWIAEKHESDYSQLQVCQRVVGVRHPLQPRCPRVFRMPWVGTYTGYMTQHTVRLQSDSCYPYVSEPTPHVPQLGLALVCRETVSAATCSLCGVHRGHCFAVRRKVVVVPPDSTILFSRGTDIVPLRLGTLFLAPLENKRCL